MAHPSVLTTLIISIALTAMIYIAWHILFAIIQWIEKILHPEPPHQPAATGAQHPAIMFDDEVYLYPTGSERWISGPPEKVIRRDN
jgi:hypothetical protein